MKFNANLILDRCRFELEKKNKSFKHGLEVCDMYANDKRKTFKYKTFQEAYINARYFAFMNGTDSIILDYKDDKYEYLSTITSSVAGLDTDLIVTALDGSGTDVEIDSFDVMNDNIDEMFKKEVSSWA